MASLPPDRKAAIEAVRTVINANLGKDFEEGMQYGAIGWYVPHRVFPAGYHCDPKQPLPYAGLGSQKNHLSLGLMSVYMDAEHDAWFRKAWKATGKKLDMGKVCIRFKRAEDLALEVIADAVRRMPAKKHVEMYVKALESMGKGPDGKPLKTGAVGTKAGAKKPAAKKPPVKKRVTKATAARKKKAVSTKR